MSFTYEFCMALTVWNEKLRILSKCSGQLGAVPCEDGEGRAQEGALRLQVQLRLLVGVEVCQRNEPRAAACTASEHHLGRARGLCGHCSHFPAHDAVAPHAVHLADVVLQLVQRQQLVAVVHHLALAGVHHYGHARWSRQLQGPRQTQTVHRHVAGQQQTGLGRHSHLVRLGESRLQFVWKQREGRVKHNPRAGNSGDAEESLRGRRGHVRTQSPQQLRIHRELVGLRSEGGPRRDARLDRLGGVAGVVLAGRVAQPGGGHAEAHSGGLGQQPRVVLHHALQASGLLEVSLTVVRVLGVHELRHHPFGALQRGHIRLQREEQLVNVAGKGRVARGWVVLVAHARTLRSQQRVQLVVLHVDGHLVPAGAVY
mmetsp:Transcript_7022/g.9964  ORF Transcript_7022/g.9964 Transcript_7022/m.9964 type:complete len:370 (-) Transcript_7022:935-2044(-)